MIYPIRNEMMVLIQNSTRIQSVLLFIDVIFTTCFFQKPISLVGGTVQQVCGNSIIHEEDSWTWGHVMDVFSSCLVLTHILSLLQDPSAGVRQATPWRRLVCPEVSKPATCWALGEILFAELLQSRSACWLESLRDLLYSIHKRVSLGLKLC